MTKEVGKPPLFTAAMYNSLEMAQLLLEKGAEVKGGELNGFLKKIKDTPLHRAALFNSYSVADLLLLKGAEINAKTVSGRTPLYQCIEGVRNPKSYYALKNSNLALVQLLLEHGADVDIEVEGKNCVSSCKRKKQAEVVELLEKYQRNNK